MWVACSNRESVRHAARMGLGALTFAFMNADEARFWVREYYETFESECTPIGRTVNPRLAMLTDFMVHEDADEARRRGLDGARFFAWGLSHYYRTGTHVPGRTDLWRAFADSPPVPHAGVGGIGSPAKVREAFEAFEEAGVDQLILLHQAGNYDAGHVTHSLGLFGEEVLPAFRTRHARRRAERAEALQPAIRRALARIGELPSVEPSPVESFPVLAERRGVDLAAVTRDRAVLPGALWRLHTSGAPRRRDNLPE
jgi:hypothetical protein